MTTTASGTLYGEGCNQANATPHARVVLGFGQPWSNGSTYGTNVFGSNTFRSLAQIESAAKAWLQGFWDCAPLGAYVRLGIGTSNYRGATGFAHGRAWANMIDRLNAFINAPPSYASMESARGASDIELGWNTPAASRAWVDGYASAYASPSLYWDYGDAAGCPPYGNCANGWTQEDVYHVAWGVAPAYPLPQIYCEACYSGDTRGGQSRQWQRLSLYGHTNHAGHAMEFVGAMTQWAAAGRCCTNAPAQGWSQLSADLNSDSRTAQQLESSTDITYAN
ncbi:MAG: hypothetical protein M3R70_06960 [Actinomycetota bacterium]|nr:hypothetical protein [Actinomycetota bacterium]